MLPGSGRDRSIGFVDYTIMMVIISIGAILLCNQTIIIIVIIKLMFDFEAI